jgi:hypothetical protein
VSELRRLQELMHHAITDPGGGSASTAAAGLAVRGSARLSAEERLGLYRRSYHMRMLEALRASYPALCHLLGREAFDEFALDYIRVRPSRSYTLLRLGQGFAEYLAATRPDEDDAWAALVVDLAALERVFTDVYEGEGSEERPPAVMNDLAADPQASVSVEACPSLRLVRCSHAVGPYLLAVRRGERPVPPVAGECFLAVSRRDYVVRFTTLDAAEFDVLQRLAGGAEVGCADWSLVRRWADAGFFRSVMQRSKELVTP